MRKLVDLEKLLEAGFGRLRSREAPHEVAELVPAIVDQVVDRVRRVRGRPTFPFARVGIVLRIPAPRRDAARAALHDVEQRIRHGLEVKGCTVPDDLAVRVICRDPRPDAADLPAFEVRCTGAPSATPPRATPPARVRIHALRGETGQRRHELRLARINIGRLETVESTSGREVRRNHVWFVEGENSVSRAHAHIRHAGGAYYLFDDGGAGGTRVIRDGDRIDVLPRAGRGVRLEDGDRLEIGRHCVLEFTLPPPAQEGTPPAGARTRSNRRAAT